MTTFCVFPCHMVLVARLIPVEEGSWARLFMGNTMMASNNNTSVCTLLVDNNLQ